MVPLSSSGTSAEERGVGSLLISSQSPVAESSHRGVREWVAGVGRDRRGETEKSHARARQRRLNWLNR